MKSGTPGANSDEETDDEEICNSGAGKIQTTEMGEMSESSFCTPARTGAAGDGALSDEDEVTQQSVPPQSQQVHTPPVTPLPGAGAEAAACIHTNNKLNKMANCRFTFQS